MVNPDRGEVEVVIGGRARIAKFDMDASVSVCRELGMGLKSIIRGIEDSRTDYTEALIFASLRARNPDLTREDLRAWFNTGYEKAGEVFSALMVRSAFVNGEKEPPEGNAPPPAALAAVA